jgi:type I restriction enzyme S subunit
VSATLNRWPRKRLGDICEFKYGRSLPESARSGGAVPVYGSNGVVGGHDVPLTGSETIVIGRKGSHGEVNFSDTPCWPIDTTYFVDSTATAAHLGWLKYRLAGAGLNQMNRAAAVPGLNREDAYRVEILLPPLKEQRRIAAILDQAETLRTQRRAALAQLASLTQSIFLDMFGEQSSSPLVALDQVCELITDGTHYTPTYADEGIIFLSAKNVTSGRIDWERIKHIPESLHQELHKRVAPRLGDVLLAKNGTTGVAAIVDRDCIFDIYVSLALLRPGHKVSSVFLHAALNSPLSKKQFNSALKGIGVPNLHLKEIRGTKIPVPPLPLQQTFATRIQAIESLKATHRAALAELDALFASLQQRAFAGLL